MEPTKPTYNRFSTWLSKRSKWWTILLILILMLTSIRFSLRSRFVLNYVRMKIMQIGNSTLNGKFTISVLNGDLWDHLIASNMNVISGDTLIHVDTLQLSYNIFHLIGSPHTVNDISISGMNARFIQEADSTWNVFHLLKKGGSDTSSSTYFDIKNLKINKSWFGIRSTFLIPDTTLNINKFTLRSAVRYTKGGYAFKLTHLSFKAKNPGLEGPLTFETAASASDNEYNLEKLVLTTSRTLLRMHGHFSGDSTQAKFGMNLLGEPISWRDLQAINNSFPIRNDIHVKLGISGDYNKTTLSLAAHSDDIKSLIIQATLKIKPEPILTDLKVDLQSARFSKISGDTLWPDIGKLQAEFQGNIPIENYKKGNLSGRISLADVSNDHYRVNRANLDLYLNSDSAGMQLLAGLKGQKVIANLRVSNPWTNRPEWKAEYRLSHLNPAVWLSDTTMNGDISLAGNIQGHGWQPGKTPWKMDIRLTKSRFNNQPVNSGNLTASVTDSLVKGNARLQFIHSAISARIHSHWSAEEPSYSFIIRSHNFNLSELNGFKKFPTSLNMKLQGNGRSFNLKKLFLTADLSADSSIVNGERMDTLSAHINIHNAILKVDNATISSSIAEGRFTAKQDLKHYDDPSNRLRYDLSLKDISSLAPLFGVNELQTKGDLIGDLQLKNNKLEFVAEMYLHDIRYDTVEVNKINGQGVIILTKQPSFKAYLELQNPSVGNVHLKDFKVNTEGNILNKVISGQFALDLNIHGKAGSTQEGTYYLTRDSSIVNIRKFVCNTSVRYLTMPHPTQIRYVNQTLSTDTLLLRAEDGAFLKMRIDHINKKVQKGFVDAENLNFGGILEIFLLHPEYSGLVSGNVNFDIHQNQVNMHSRLSMSKMTYHDLKLDSLRFSMKIEKGQMLADGFVENKGQKIITGEADLPFHLGYPLSIDTSFFKRPISGFLKTGPIDLSKYQDFLKEFGYGGLTGTLRFNSTLSGNAGLPNIRGRMTLTGSKFSDVAIDTVDLGFQYQQSEKQLEFNSRIISLKQTAAKIKGFVPFSLDLRQFALNFPTSADSIHADIYTNDLNLSALNEFVSPETAKELNGTLNANIKVRGTIGNPYLEGDMRLGNGAIKIIPANILLKKITMNTVFEPHKVTIKELNVSSNGGNLTANGNIAIKGYQSTSFNLAFKAKKFRVMDTRDYKAVVSLDSKLSGTMAHPVLNGELTIDNGTFYLDNFGSKSVEEIHLVKKAPNPISETALYDSLKMDVKLNINRNFWLRNRTSPELGMELNGNVEATKAPRDSLRIFGEFKSNQGYATQFGKRFELASGNVAFSGDPTNPQLDIKTLYKLKQPNDISIYYLITGTVRNPRFNYQSDPSMDLKNIISYTLFNRPFNALLSWEQTVSGSSSTGEAAKSALMNLLLDRVENLATERLGIDVIQIDNTGQTTGNGTTIKIGKYITDRVFLAVLQQLGGNNQSSQVILEYYLYKNLGLILTQSEGQDSKTGIDILWHYDY